MLKTFVDSGYITRFDQVSGIHEPVCTQSTSAANKIPAEIPEYQVARGSVLPIRLGAQVLPQRDRRFLIDETRGLLFVELHHRFA